MSTGRNEGGASPQAIRLTPIFQKINLYAKTNGPHGKWLRLRDFLEEFISAHSPGFDWQEDARQGETEDRIRQQQDERIAQEHAEHVRWNRAWVTKFYTPNVPDDVALFFLAWERRKQKRLARRTWPTLRELKLATAIPERTLKKIIKNLRPQKNEMTKEPRIVPLIFDPSRHKSSRRGTVPLRYGPRLVIGVLNEFLNRLPEFPIDDGERKRLRQTAIRVKRAFVARLSRSR